ATILAMRPDCVDSVTDPFLEKTLPKEACIERVGAFSKRWTKFFGIGGLSYRAWQALRKRGEELLENANFDLVFFSTTEFLFMALGARWLARFGVPYV